ncbi:hypothetical protein GCM10023169_38010 [Georgenia halophila]|uniref:Guanylate cyclase domain-containing protein n=1 Tax=Georgenia halophila TaxID=620889 RepID=A0ABP8LPL6_9MICO
MTEPRAGPSHDYRALPDGTVTMLFSDMEGSTALLRRLGDRYAEVVTLQRRIQRDAFVRHGGHELGTEGDSFFVAFSRAQEAVAAALTAQRAIAEVSWPGDAAVRIRTGLHTGEPRRHEDGYVGLDVHRAARVAAAAHGGQILLTEATRRLAGDVPGTGAKDLGEHRLRDLPGTTRLYQLLADGLDADFPPPRTLGRGSSVPQFSTTLVGRDVERRALEGFLTEQGCRLVSVTGPGGVGKTRLAAAVATDLDGAFRDGVHFVPLAPIRSPDVMWSTLAETLGMAEQLDDPAQLLEDLATRDLLLLLDNLEHLHGAADVVDQLVRAGPSVRVLTTSRRPLHITGEQEFPLSPLEVPEGASLPDVSLAPAVDLFVQRARLVRPTFVLDDHNVADVVAVCRQLDGVPLAIELVAAAAKMFGPRAMRARVGRCLEMVTSAVGVPDRQRTLRAAIAWSYDLLPPPVRRAFRQLGVFDGEFDLEAAAAVLDDDAEPLDLIAELIDASLVMVREAPDGEPRLRVLRTVAAFGRERLAEEGEEHDTRRRHAGHYLDLAESAGPQLRSSAHLLGRDRLVAAGPNLRGALTWCFGTDGLDRPADIRTGLRLCQQLAWFWYGCGHRTEGRRWLSVAAAAAEGDTDEHMDVLHGLAVLTLQTGDADRSRELLTRTLAHHRRRGDARGVARSLNALGGAHRALGDPEGARALWTEAADTARATGMTRPLATAVSNLAALELDAGNHDAALPLFRESLELDRGLGDAWGITAGHINIATTYLRAGHLDASEQCLVEQGSVVLGLGDDELVVDVLEIACAIAARRGQARRAARLLGAARALRRRAELAITEPDRVYLEAQIAPVRAASDPLRWAADEADGALLDADAALGEATERAPTGIDTVASSNPCPS